MGEGVLFRYIQGDAAQDEKERVAEWLDSDPAHMREFMKMRMAYDAILWNDLSVASGRGRKRKLIADVLKIAAAFALALAAARIFIPHQAEAPLTYQTLHMPEGQRGEITLSDNTKVWLNAGSTLVFPSRFPDNERTVELIGEAYFDVAGDKTRPFAVTAGSYRVTALGTEFGVKSYPEHGLFETSLIEGSVEVRSLADGVTLLLDEERKAYADDGRLMVARLDNHNHLLWREGILSFEAETFWDILSELELYYGVDFQIRNDSILNETYTGKFWIRDGIDHVLKVLQLNHKFRYTKDGLKDITIY